MINVKNTELIIGLITFLLAYLVSVTLVGAFRAWVAKKMGDNTAEDIGLLSLDPLVHIDPIGLLFLFLFYFGWGRHVPINPYNIDGRFKRMKLFVAYLSDTGAHFLIALSCLTLLIGLFDVTILPIARYMVLGHDMSHLYIAHAFPSYSSLTVSIAFILVALVYLNVVLGVLDLIINGFSLFMYFLAERSPRYIMYNSYVIILVPILLIFFFSAPLKLLTINAISYVGYFLAYMFGIA